MHCSSEFSLRSTIPYNHLKVQNYLNVKQSSIFVDEGSVYAVDVLFLSQMGLIVAWQVKKKVPYCFSAVDSCCYATNRMSLSTGYIKFVFPAHISARSFYTLTGGYGSDFL